MWKVAAVMAMVVRTAFSRTRTGQISKEPEADFRKHTIAPIAYYTIERRYKVRHYSISIVQACQNRDNIGTGVCVLLA